MNAARTAFPRIVPFSLSFIAGYVDGVIFLALFGIYVAQATGSFVIVGSYWWHQEPGFVVKVLAIPTFILGGIVSALIVETRGKRRRSALLITLALEEIFLFGLLLAGLLGLPAQSPDDPGALMASLCGLLAMGMQSALVRLLMPEFGSTNVMTTNTTVVAIDLTRTVASWLRKRRSGEDAGYAASRSKLANSLIVVVGFLAGTTAGAFGFVHAGLWALVVPLITIDATAAWLWFNTTDEAAV